MDVFLVFVCFMVLLDNVSGRARLIEPPMRSSIWRYNIYNVPKNLLDDHLNCGGFEYQWTIANGRCGSCGDPYFGPSNNVYPGIYANNVMTRTVTQGSLLNVSVFANQNQLGYFQFYLCPDMNGQEYIDLDECFDRHPLQILDTFSSTFYVGSGGGLFNMKLILPAEVSCEHCVLKWVYVTGYREGRDLHSCRDCLGCGPQETFINCADFTIEAADPPKMSKNQRAIAHTSTPATSSAVNVTVTDSPGQSLTESPFNLSTTQSALTEQDANGLTTLKPGSVSVLNDSETTPIPDVLGRPAQPTGPKLLISGTLTGDASGVTEGSNAISINLNTLIENASNLTNPPKKFSVQTNSTPSSLLGDNSSVTVPPIVTSRSVGEGTTFVTPVPSTTMVNPFSSTQTNSSTSSMAEKFTAKQSFPLTMVDGSEKKSMGAPKMNISVSSANSLPTTGIGKETYYKDSGLFEPILPKHSPGILRHPENNSQNAVPRTTTPPASSVISAMRINVKKEYCFSNSTYIRCESKNKTIEWCLEQCYNSTCPTIDCSCYCMMLDGKTYPISSNPITVLQRLPVYSHKDRPKKLCYRPRPKWQNVTGLAVWCKTNCPGLRCYGLCTPQPCR